MDDWFGSNNDDVRGEDQGQAKIDNDKIYCGDNEMRRGRIRL